MKIEDFADKNPAFILENFFSRSLRGWGVTLGRLGKFQNRFTIDAEGQWDAAAHTLALREIYTFDDGHIDILTWTIIKRSNGTYEGRETLIEGLADGEQSGNAFHWHYHRNVPSADGTKSKFGFDDWFFLHDDGNHMTAYASLTKLGIEFATLNAFYERVV